MTYNHYYVTKKSMKDNTLVHMPKFKGFNSTPKNTINYDGIVVSKLFIVNPLFIEYILKRKIRRKLELYLNFIMDFIDSDEDDGTGLREALNDISRYRDIINYKYRKYLNDKYIDWLLERINILESELKIKIYMISEKEAQLSVEENIMGRSR